MDHAFYLPLYELACFLFWELVSVKRKNYHMKAKRSILPLTKKITTTIFGNSFVPALNSCSCNLNKTNLYYLTQKLTITIEKIF